MNEDYRVNRSKEVINVSHCPSKYRLEIDLKAVDAPYSNLYEFDISFSNGGVLISGRDLHHYDRRLQFMDVRRGTQFVEIGAGLGGFIPYIIGKTRRKPIVIDFANYRLMKLMLTFAKSLNLGKNVDKRLDVLIGRCELVTDPKKVRLINLQLSQALRQNPDLRGIADVLVDHYGAHQYPVVETSPRWDAKQRISELEKSLLKRSAIHLVCASGDSRK